MKFCKDCKHFFSGRCESPKAEDYRYKVTGAWPSAEWMRRGFPFKTLCGSDARWYEATFAEADHAD